MYEDARFAGNIKKVFDTHEITMAGAAGNATVKIGMVTSDLREAIQDVEFIFVAVPALPMTFMPERWRNSYIPARLLW